jgi:hypothetical protein
MLKSTESASRADEADTTMPSLPDTFQTILDRLENILRTENWLEEHLDIAALLDSCLLKLKLWSQDIKGAEVTLAVVEDSETEVLMLTRSLFDDISSSMDRFQYALQTTVVGEGVDGSKTIE